MITKEFELHVEGFAKSPLSSNDLEANFALGLAGESGDVADLVKKFLFHGLDLDRKALILELGDLLWYWVALAQMFDLSTEEIMSVNMRHGGGAINDHQEFELYVEKFSRAILSPNGIEVVLVLGLVGKSGKVTTRLNNHLTSWVELDRKGLILEMGDLLWYWTAIAQAFDLSPSEIMAANIAKLQSRHGGTSFDRAKAAAAKAKHYRKA